MSNGIAKNLERVTEQFPALLAEWNEQTVKIKDALSRKDYKDALHHASGYLEAAIQHPTKLWFYTWVPKWSLVAYLIWG